MKLARVICDDGGTWGIVEPGAVICKPPIETLIQYEYDEGRDTYNVYFPGVRGFAPMSSHSFTIYFEDLDDETS